MTLNNALSDLIGKVLNDTSNGKSVVTIQISKDNTDSKTTSSVNISIETPRDTPTVSVTKVAEIVPTEIDIVGVKLTQQELQELKTLVTKKEQKVIVRKEVDAYDAGETSDCETLAGNNSQTLFCNIDNVKVNDDDVDVSGIYDQQMDKLHKYRNELRDEVGYSKTAKITPSSYNYDASEDLKRTYSRLCTAREAPATLFEKYTPIPWSTSADEEFEASMPVKATTTEQTTVPLVDIKKENDLILNWSKLVQKDTEIKPHIVIEMSEDVEDVNILPSIVESDADEETNSVHSSEYEIMSDSDPNMLD